MDRLRWNREILWDATSKQRTTGKTKKEGKTKSFTYKNK